MTRIQLKDGSGQIWWYDEVAAARLISRNAYLNALDANSSVLRTRESLIQKLRLARELAEVAFDPEKVEQAKQRNQAILMRTFAQKLQGKWDDAQSFLVNLKQRNAIYLSRQTERYGTASYVNELAIEQAKASISTARKLRDGSVMAISVIAVVGTGGIGYVALGLSASGTGVATYQDTGSVSKSLVSGAMVAMPLAVGKHVRVLGGPKIQTFVTALVDVGAELTNSVYVKEQDISRAIGPALANAGLGASAGMVQRRVVRQIGAPLGRAVSIANDHSKHVSNRLPSLLTQGVAKVGVKILKVEVSSPSAGPVARDSIIRQCVMRGTSPEQRWVESRVLGRAP